MKGDYLNQNGSTEKRNVTQELISENYYQIKRDIITLIESEIKKLRDKNTQHKDNQVIKNGDKKRKSVIVTI
jgi:hypothetical protein